MCAPNTHLFKLKKGIMQCKLCKKIAVYNPLTRTWE